MNIKILSNPSTTLIKEVFLDPNNYRVWKGYEKPANHDIITLNPDDKWVVGMDVETGKSIGIAQYKHQTDYIADGHILVFPKYWGTGVSLGFINTVFTYLVKNTTLKYLITMVPSNCTQVLRCAEKVGFELMSKFEKAAIYNGELVDYLYYMKTLR
jgi:RimJ/RimL family protein N-acetyltransferase